MVRQRFGLKHLASFGAVLSIFATQVSASTTDNKYAGDALRGGFADPPSAARPRVWWHWINGNVSPEGAKLDLEWMKRVGIGGVHVFSGGLPGPVVVKERQPFMSEGWNETLRQSLRIATAAGMEVGIAGSPGWSHTGGPWVPPEDGMKKYVWSETRVSGTEAFNGILAAPPQVTGPFLTMKRGGKSPLLYRDSYIVAFPTPEYELAPELPELSASDVGVDLSAIIKDPLSSKVRLSAASGEPAWIQARYRVPTTLSALTLGLPSGANVELQTSSDGSSFQTVAKVLIESPKVLTHPLVQQTISITPVTGRVFRVVLEPIVQPASLPTGPGPAPKAAPPPAYVEVSNVVFERGARVNRFEAKAGFQPSVGLQDVATPQLPRAAVIPAKKVIDLTDKFRSGRLDWHPPQGEWTILRFGWSLTGQTNGPAEPEATGLEVDKLDASAVRRYIDRYLDLYKAATGNALGPQGIQTLLTDSWEAGVQNWTPELLTAFHSRRGYNPLPYLPVLSGRVVGSATESDRFLWDFRQTLKDLVADNHHGVLAQALHQKQMTFYTEVQGDTPRAIADGMTLKARSDIPTAEYWYRPFAAGPGQFALKADIEEAASAAHVYGKPLVAAEALTVAAAADPWAFSPRMLKPVADEIFVRGVNRILMHDSHHQPLVDAKPGLMLMMFGQFFNRNDTWAEDAKPWVDYLSRTSFLLQQGQYVADVAYFYGEDKTLTELFRERPNNDVPEGYRYDYINPEALLTLLSVKDGNVVTRSGMEYRVLFMPEHVNRMTLPAIRVLRDLVAGGATLVGAKPVGGLGLASDDRAVLRIANRMWGKRPSPARKFGKGRIYADLRSALAGQAIVPDFEMQGRSAQGNILSLHRRTDEADIYFVSNQAGVSEALNARFRVVGKVPELWRAETGSREPVAYLEEGGRTVVPLNLAPHEAVFVVFADAKGQGRPETWRSTERHIQALTGAWSVRFQEGRGAPERAAFNELISWAESPDPRIKFFSGAGTYAQNFDVAAGAFQERRRFMLDLGDVRELATVTVNGIYLGTVWHAPYKIDVTRALRPGTNRVAIRVVNLWPNRLIGDKQDGATPIAFAPQARYKADSPLLPSGLLGPVNLLAVDLHAQ